MRLYCIRYIVLYAVYVGSCATLIFPPIAAPEIAWLACIVALAVFSTLASPSFGRDHDVHLPAHALVHGAEAVVCVLHLLFDVHGGFFGAGAVFEEEGEFFEGAAVGFGEHEVLELTISEEVE